MEKNQSTRSGTPQICGNEDLEKLEENGDVRLLDRKSMTWVSHAD